MIRANQQVKCYLTDKANDALAEMVARGVDEDLALTLLESLLPETELYIALDEVLDG